MPIVYTAFIGSNRSGKQFEGWYPRRANSLQLQGLTVHNNPPGHAPALRATPSKGELPPVTTDMRYTGIRCQVSDSKTRKPLFTLPPWKSVVVVSALPTKLLGGFDRQRD